MYRANPPQIMNVKQLLLVSAGGLGVNLWGMYATGHHHHHGHGHHDHGHDHGDHVSIICLESRRNILSVVFSRQHHGHGHSANMHGVFLVSLRVQRHMRPLLIVITFF